MTPFAVRRESAKMEPDDTNVCVNCGCPRAEHFCPICGQERISPVQPLRELWADTAGEFLKWDSKLLVTLKPLLLKPGFLTAEYLRGKRVPYISPMRLYLWVSAFYFFFFSLSAQKQLSQAFVLPTRAAQAAPLSTPTPATTAAPAATPSPTSAPSPTMPPDRTDRLKAKLSARMAAGGKWYSENMATVAIFLLPVYAAATGLLQWRLRRLYVEHLIYTVHTQTFGFLCSLLCLSVLGGMLSLGYTFSTLGALLVYNFFALRRIYGQSVAVCAVKSLLIIAFHFAISMVVGVTTVLGFVLWPG